MTFNKTQSSADMRLNKAQYLAKRQFQECMAVPKNSFISLTLWFQKEWSFLSWCDCEKIHIQYSKIPGTMEFWNFVLKIMYLDKAWVGKIPYSLKLAKPRQIQGIPGFLNVWILGFKNEKMLPKVRKNFTIMLQGFSLFYLSKNCPLW